MKGIRDFFKTALLGGVVIMLPIAILFFVAKWLFSLVTAFIDPFTSLIETKSKFQELLVDLVVIAILLAVCFAVGVFTRTRLGAFLYGVIDEWLLRIAPGYSLIKETVAQLLGGKKSPFSAVALVQAFDSPTLMTAFVVARHGDGYVTVFAPCGPNPTTGYILHLKEDKVYPVNIPVEEAMRSIIACGVGSSGLVREFNSRT